MLSRFFVTVVHADRAGAIFWCESNWVLGYTQGGRDSGSNRDRDRDGGSFSNKDRNRGRDRDRDRDKDRDRDRDRNGGRTRPVDLLQDLLVVV